MYKRKNVIYPDNTLDITTDQNENKNLFSVVKNKYFYTSYLNITNFFNND